MKDPAPLAREHPDEHCRATETPGPSPRLASVWAVLSFRRQLALALLGCALVGCGDSTGGEATLGGKTTKPANRHYGDQIANLKREMRSQRRELARRRGEPT